MATRKTRATKPAPAAKTTKARKSITAGAKVIKSGTPPNAAPVSASASVPKSDVAASVEIVSRVEPEVPKKSKKVKVVRDGFTMPEADYAKIAGLKKKCLAAGISVKKSELLRAGLRVLDGFSIEKLKAELDALDSVKTGRPTK